ncbi:uncharacterized protein LOC133175761 [Saccostrea echinata]|uniref:uncharacterized protein LOC133175761 n=1 Tax=Saccostrea echinata TaxID=191078 RepID=UPI002A7F1638|nr:uncharacterized protein LOC133175761 [Saccostrea echinata]XP_061166855.1 uncharacterized protein LOC133175761 [Saccostrea echinata]
MAQYKIPDPEEMIPCPYDKVHMIRAKRMQYHLMKCRKNYAGSDFATCPFNARHEMPKPELRYHLANCPDKAVIEPMLAYESSKRNGEDASMFRGCTDLPVYDNVVINSEENWDDEIPSVARIGVDPQFFARQDHMIIPGLTKSEKKEFAKQMHIPAEDRKYLAQYKEPEQPIKDEQPKLRLPKTAAQTYLPHQKKLDQPPSAVFAYSLSMAGVGRGLPVNSQNGPVTGSLNGPPGMSRGRGHGSSPAVGRGISVSEMNGDIPRSLGRGMTNGDVPLSQQETVEVRPPELQNNSPVFSVGIGRGCKVPNGTISPPSFVVPTVPQQKNNAQEKDSDLESEGSQLVEDLDKKLKKIEKKLRQIELLEEKLEEGYNLTKEETAKVNMKESLTVERDNLQENARLNK